MNIVYILILYSTPSSSFMLGPIEVDTLQIFLLLLLNHVNCNIYICDLSLVSCFSLASVPDVYSNFTHVCVCIL